MWSYQRLNQTYARANGKSQNGLLKGELGFRGFVVSDWSALYGGLEYATGGLNMGMPNAASWDKNLVQAVRNVSFAEARVTDMATRIVAAWYQVGQDKGFPRPGIGMPNLVTDPHTVVEARDPRNQSTILQGAIEGHVLVKNEKHTLPLRSPKMLSIFGYSANTPPNWTAAEDVERSWTYGKAAVLGRNENRTVTAPLGTRFGGGGSGAITPTTSSSPRDALVAKAAEDGFTLLRGPWFQSAISAAIVGRLHCLWQCLGHRKDGPTGPPRRLHGCLDPDNRQPVRQDDRRPAQRRHQNRRRLCRPPQRHGPSVRPLAGPGQRRGAPRPPLAPVQLSYTRYDFSAMGIHGPLGNFRSKWPQRRVISGGQEDLWETLATVSCTVVNRRGPADGAEVAQLYVRIPGTEAKQLCGFAKEFPRVGQSARVSFGLTRPGLSVWDTGAQKWLLQRGRYEIYVGRGSARMPLRATLAI
ncbi:hypothetical protein E4U53_000776 [Claviceps sorghi]|nr:hypothetical protein E4U53_000776 [Claviceps sorghi]